MERSPFFEGWKHCPRCAGPLAIDGREAECGACGRRVYANPAPTATAVIVDDDGSVLLARRVGDPGAGKWDLPGGFIEEGESALDSLRRELEEEAGVAIEPGELLAALPDRYGDEGIFTINFYWLARISAGKPSPSDDVAKLEWFAPDALPSEDEFAFRNTVEALRAWRACAEASSITTRE
jgi:8-oxo-dGTP diphosphatase